ncbi:MAG: hypothetical protein JSW50_00060, partial [Candidatus Latescibacterota bacterium]
MKTKRRVLSFAGIDPMRLFGQRESHLDILEERFPGVVVVRGDEIILNGTEADIKALTDFFVELIEAANKGRVVTEEQFRRLLKTDGGNRRVRIEDVDREVIVVTRGGHTIRPRTVNQ